MSTVTITATVRESCGAYNCTIHKTRGSSTMNAETAVRRAAEKHAKAAGLAMKGARLAGRPSIGIEVWEITLEGVK